MEDSVNGKYFTRVSECLLFYELPRLLDWFELILSERKISTKIDFIEPELAFGYQDEVLSVQLCYDLAPVNHNGNLYRLTFPLDDKTLLRIIKELKEVLAKYKIA